MKPARRATTRRHKTKSTGSFRLVNSGTPWQNRRSSVGARSVLMEATMALITGTDDNDILEGDAAGRRCLGLGGEDQSLGRRRR